MKSLTSVVTPSRLLASPLSETSFALTILVPFLLPQPPIIYVKQRAESNVCKLKEIGYTYDSAALSFRVRFDLNQKLKHPVFFFFVSGLGIG
jgi:hypothetical protein